MAHGRTSRGELEGRVCPRSRGGAEREGVWYPFGMGTPQKETGSADWALQLEEGILLLMCWMPRMGAAQENPVSSLERETATSEVGDTNPLRLFLGGDVMVGRYVNGVLREHGGENPVSGDGGPGASGRTSVHQSGDSDQR